MQDPNYSPQASSPVTVQPVIDPQEKIARNWAMACHLAGLSAFIGVPFGHIFGPLLIWLLKKDEIPAVADQGREALNFGITMTIAHIVAALSIFVLIGFVALPLVLILHLVWGITAAIRASEGQLYRYPFSIRFVN
jgi:uncharacterized Tic20 family protein